MARSNSFIQAAAPATLIIVCTLALRLLPDNPARSEPNETETFADRRSPVPLADPATQQKLEQAVSGQLNAIRKGDFPLALSFSDEAFRKQWSAEKFGQMVTKAFPRMASFKQIKFRPARTLDDQALLLVTLTGKDNTATPYIYGLVRENGEWHIRTANPAQRR